MRQDIIKKDLTDSEKCGIPLNKTYNATIKNALQN